MINIKSHILSDVVEEMKNPENCAEKLKEFKKQGFEHIFFTPEINSSHTTEDIQKIKDDFEKIQKIAKEIGLKVHLGSEIPLYDHKDRKFIPILGRFLLVKLPEDTQPHYLFDEIFELQLEGYEIIITNIENCPWIIQNKRTIKKLKRMNVYFHIESSILNTKLGKQFLKKNYVEFVSTEKPEKTLLDPKCAKNFSVITYKSKEILGLK